MDILGNAGVVVGCFFLMWQLVHWGEKWNRVSWRKQRQQIRRQKLRHSDACDTSVCKNATSVIILEYHSQTQL